MIDCEVFKQLQPGDKLLVLQDLNADDHECGIDEEMLEQQGKVVTVVSHITEWSGRDFIKIEEDGEYFVWDETCFECIIEMGGNEFFQVEITNDQVADCGELFA